MNGQFNVLIIDEVHPVLTEGLIALGMGVDYQPNISPSDIVSIIHQYQGLVVRTKLIIDTNVLSRAIQLKFIGRAGAGLDNIDTAYCEAHQIICFNAGEANADAVGEHTLAMLLSLSTQLQKADKEVRMGLWDRKGNTGWELKGKTVGIVGFGNTGKAVAQKLKGFGVRVIVYDKYLLNYGSADAKEVSMETIQQEADIVSFHVPLTPETYHMVNSTWIAGCKKQIVLLNLSRGKVANLNDVVDALEKNDLKAAGLDVLENENLSDLTSEELFIQQRLVKFENTVLSPHVGGWTTESFEKISRVLLQKIKELTLA
jgi:D-3-phosphoglycerate dehydrogenase / 2-oxoglutarate reductase